MKGISENRSPNFHLKIITKNGDMFARLITNDNIDGNVHCSGAEITINGNSIQTVYISIQLLKLNIIIRAKQIFSANLCDFNCGLEKLSSQNIYFS